MNRLSIGYSPCPNDTFIFYGLTHGEVTVAGVEFEPEVLADVETLNQWAQAGRLDVTKLSFPALGLVLDQYVLLGAGAALGRGCGPLLVARQHIRLEELSEKTIAIPGRLTTAAMLLQLFAPQCAHLAEMRFDEIMPAVASGDADCGVIIHESRFTYHRMGLVLLTDLGAWWEQTSGLPIPLGGIAARRTLGKEVIAKIEAGIRESIRFAYAHPDRCLGYIRQHAREIEEGIIADHIGLYVNRYSENLGTEGLAAVEAFFKEGRKRGLLPGLPEGRTV